MIIYPPQLPLPLRDSYSLKPVSPLMRTPLNSGRSRQRRKFTSVPTEPSVQWLFNDQQAAFFEAWFARTLEDGTRWFEMPLQTPEGFHNYQCRFTDIYSELELVGVDHWRTSAVLEMLKRPLINPGWDQFPDLWFGASIIDLALNKEWPEP